MSTPRCYTAPSSGKLVVMKKPTAYDAKLRREVALLLHLGEITTKEVMEMYELPSSYGNKLRVWKSRAKSHYEGLDQIAQENAYKHAMQRFYGSSYAAIKDAAKDSSEAPVASQEILDDQGIAEFINSINEPEILEPVKESTPEASGITDIPKDITTITSEPLQEFRPAVRDNIMSPEAYEQGVQNLKSGGITAVENTLKTLQNETNGVLCDELKILDNIIKYLRDFNITQCKLRDIKTVAEVTEKVLSLRRKALLLPYGHLDPNAKPHVNVSKQLHFHNHGLSGFDPNIK